MSRPPATIVVPVWNAWEHTRRCLESLRPTLGVRDEVVAVDNGSTDATGAGLARYPWVRVLTNPENRGFAAACNQGAAVAHNDVIVFLNNDTLLPARWLDGLLRPFTDPTVLATGPRSNAVSGPQLVPTASYDAGRVAEFNRFARRWREEHRGEVSQTTRLVGFCLAVRRSSFEAIGGFDEAFGIGGFEDDDLSRRLVECGGRLLIAHESFVHHEGHRTFDANGLDWYAEQQHNAEIFTDKHMLVSACLIVRDEEEMLPECLASLTGLVDEVVVYDTGSTDATMDIARAAGARVVEGYWDDDFAAARNRALEHCRGTWVLQIDADERVQGDVAALRSRLRRTKGDVFDIRIDNVGANGGIGVSHTVVRLFRQARAHWTDRLHEHVVARPGIGRLSLRRADEVRLAHLGYRKDVFAAKDKAARNLRLAEQMADGDDVHPALAALQIGRALLTIGRVDDALAAFDRARSQADGLPLTRQVALRHGIETLVRVGRAGEAHEWLSAVRAAETTADMGRWLEAAVLAAEGEPERALEQLDGLGEVSDADGYSVPEHQVCGERGRLLARLDRWPDAAQELERSLMLGSTDVRWGHLADACRRAGYVPVAAIDGVPADRRVSVVGEILAAPADTADYLLDAWHRRRPEDRAVLAAVPVLAEHLSLPRALEWSARLRAAGFAEKCPLRLQAAQPDRPPLSRLHAAAVAFGTFADATVVTAARQAGAELPDGELRVAMNDVGALAPDLVPELTAAAAMTKARCRILAEMADAIGVSEAAAALRAHGDELAA